MSFVRIKRVKGIPYAKLVRNVWKKRKGQPRQKLVRHLGRVHIPEKSADVKADLEGCTDYKSAVNTLMRAELLRHGFSETSEGIFESAHVSFSMHSLKAHDKRNGKPVVLSFNNGIFCEEHLQKVFNFDPQMEIGKQPGSVLSKIYEQAGFNAKDESCFIMLYKKSVEKENMTLDEFKKKYL